MLLLINGIFSFGCYFCKIFLARDIAAESRDSQDDLWERILRDEYMKYAVVECYHSIKLILMEILEEHGRKWLVNIENFPADNNFFLWQWLMLMCKNQKEPV